MSATNDELLFNAAKSGNLAMVEDLLSKGTGTGYKDRVSYFWKTSMMMMMMMMIMRPMYVASMKSQLYNSILMILLSSSSYMSSLLSYLLFKST